MMLIYANIITTLEYILYLTMLLCYTCCLLQDSVYPRAHTCFNKLDLPLYESQRELDAYLSVVINMENMTGFTIE